jgi:hypothetical protein
VDSPQRSTKLASRLCESVILEVELTAVASKVVLCETIGMATKQPKIGDWVTVRGSPVVYVVTDVNTEEKTADVKATRDVVVLHKDVPWANLFRLDKSQYELRIVTKVFDKH